MTTIKKIFGAHLFQLRNKAGLTQARLAEKTDLSVDSISRIERGDRAPSLESIEKLSNALKIRMPELFNFGGEEIAALSECPPESLQLWKLLKGKRPSQVKKLTEIAKIVLE
ncbi:MAG: helix-turn-helix transcriptional regulator [Deltaproteobacteria bacterium]|nr:helix-turn-helix transcriptional regulator [Deltaproteobacteria bacterium]